MARLKKISLHIVVILIICIIFTLLFYIGNLILINIVTVKPEDRWEYSYTLPEIFTSFAIGFCLPGYLFFLAMQFLLKKNKVKIPDPVIATTSFLITAFLILLSLANGIIFTDPYSVKNLVVIAFAGFIASLIKKVLFRKYIIKAQ